MSKRYTKFNSNYILRSKHQTTSLGTIVERDWVTTNGLNVLRFGSGRRIWYNSGNFVFTTSNIPTYHKKHKLTTETKEWTWDDCKDADGTANTVQPNFITNDIRDYAYYGSCVELIRATIEDIITDFPGRLITSNNTLDIFNGTTVNTEETYYYKNDKGWKTVKFSKTQNEDSTYTVNVDYESFQGEPNIAAFQNITEAEQLVLKVDQSYYFIYTKDNTIELKNLEKDTTKDEKEDFPFVSTEQKDVKKILQNDFNIDLHHRTVTLGKYDNEFRFMSNSWSKYCIKTIYGEEKVINFNISEWLGDKDCPRCNEGQIVVNITFTTQRVIEDESKLSNNVTYTKKYLIQGYSVNDNIVYVYVPNFNDGNVQYNEADAISIQPQQEYIDEYFLSLKGFKAQLLRQDTKAYYTNKFKTPVEYNFTWYYPEKTYVWPSNDYCIDINSIAFTTFCDKLFDMGQKFDELWTDNIYRSMTHESIKNFDWTYSRQYYEGEEQDNIDGGERMQKILRVFGRVFDDVKYYIDTIKQMTNTTYDKIKNAPEALLSDAVYLKGVEVLSTIGTDYDIDEYIDSDFLKEKVTKDDSWIGSPSTSMHKKWYQNKNSEDIYPDVCDNEIMRRFTISAKRLMQTKGTQHAIDMIMGFFGFGRNPLSPSANDDYFVEEEAYYTKKLIPYNECVDGSNDNSDVKGTDWTSSDVYPVDWANVKSSTKGEVITEVNSEKDQDDLPLLYMYTDDYSGIPLRTVYIGHKNTPYIVPYYDGDQLYDGDLVFQSKGGWGKFVSENDTYSLDDCFDYQETLSYLHVVGTIGELLAVNGFDLEKYDIYYVVNLSDYTDYDENPPFKEGEMTVSHYFTAINQYEPDKLYSWKNIVIKPTSTDGELERVSEDTFKEFFGDDEYADWFYDTAALKKQGNVSEPTEEEQRGTYEYVFKHLKYLENIVSTNIGNNPHVGYGNYDDGSTYLEYMKKPFKYALDKSLIPSIDYRNIANLLDFGEITDNKVTEKIQVMCETVNSDGDSILHSNENGDYNEEDEIWYINTKVVTITNNIESKYTLITKTLYGKYTETDADGNEKIKDITITDEDSLSDVIQKGGSIFIDEEKTTYARLNVDYQNFYLTYFKGVILPYLMQVIPSTTILKLKGYN